ncbi:MAG: hypothetical protein Kow0089_15280 [Desulfobulbaceae bacterium]
MENNSEIVRLEEFVDNLLARYRKMKETCGALEKVLEEKDEECARLKATIEELRSERSVVGERVAGLIDRIEQWEKELEEGEEARVTDLEKLQGKLFQKNEAAAE